MEIANTSRQKISKSKSGKLYRTVVNFIVSYRDYILILFGPIQPVDPICSGSADAIHYNTKKNSKTVCISLIALLARLKAKATKPTKIH